jgi:fructosamine-3-kinase
MRSNSKVPVEREQIDALVRRHLDHRPTAIHELTDGMYNAAYRVDLAGHDPVVLKIAPPDGVPGLTYEQSLMRSEASYFGHAQGRAPVPEVIAADFSRSVIDRDVLVLSLLPGRPMQKIGRRLSRAQRETVRSQLGASVARLHGVRGPMFGYDRPAAELSGPTWPAAFGLMWDAVLRDAARYDVELGVPTARLRDVLKSNLAELDVVDEPALVHFDLWDGNVFAAVEGGVARLSGIIDGERMFWGDPMADFVSTSLFRDPAADGAFNTSYVSAGGRRWAFDDAERRRLALYNAYLCMLMLVESAPRQYRGIVSKLTNRYVRARLRASVTSLAVPR